MKVYVSDRGDGLGVRFGTLERTQAVLYVQHHIRHPGWDLRVFVLARRPDGHDGCMLARRLADECCSGAALGEIYRVGAEEERLALRATAALGALAAGVDLLPGPHGQGCSLEVNAVPGWRALAPVTGVDAATALVRYLAEEYPLE